MHGVVTRAIVWCAGWPGTELVGEMSPILLLPNVTASTGGMYTCVVSNLAGNDNASTSVFAAPYFVSQPRDVLVSVGSSATLVCTAESFPNPDYQWQRRDGRPIRSGIVINGRNLTISSIQYGDEGEYYCNASANQQTIVSEVGIIIGGLIDVLCFLFKCACTCTCNIFVLSAEMQCWCMLAHVTCVATCMISGRSTMVRSNFHIFSHLITDCTQVVIVQMHR